jgi:hypothetical protein
MPVFLIFHFIADFLLQSRAMGKKKSESFKMLLKHLGIIFGVFFVGGALFFYYLYFNIPYMKVDRLTISLFCAFITSLLNTIAHGIIDANIWKLYKLSVYMRVKNDQNFDVSKWAYWDDSWFYSTIGLDQLLHVLTIYFIYGFFR